MCLRVLSPCVYMYHIHAWFPWNSEKGIRSPGTGVMNDYNAMGFGVESALNS